MNFSSVAILANPPGERFLDGALRFRHRQSCLLPQATHQKTRVPMVWRMSTLQAHPALDSAAPPTGSAHLPPAKPQAL